MEELISKFGLENGVYSGNRYIVTLDSDIEWSGLFSRISLDGEFKLEGQSIATDDESKFVFTNGYYDIILEANYKKELYTVNVEEK